VLEGCEAGGLSNVRMGINKRGSLIEMIFKLKENAIGFDKSIWSNFPYTLTVVPNRFKF
jgi:hypothetical protein